MAQFLAQVFDPACGRVEERSVESDSVAQVRQAIEGAGQVVLDIKPGAPERHARPARGMPLDIIWWCRELRTLVAAGMTVVEALETLHAQTVGRSGHALIASLLQQLQQGLSLSEAMRAQGVFPAMLLASIKASERTSGLVGALDEFIRYREMLARMRRTAVSAAIYPALVVGLGGVIVTFLLLFVLPRFSRMYTERGAPLSTITSWLIGFSRLVSEHRPLATGLLLGAALAIVFAWREGWIARAALWGVESFGPLRAKMDEFRLATLYQSLALMFRGGYAIDEALQQCAGLGLGPRFERGIASAHAALQRGQRLSLALTDAGLTDLVTGRLLAVGERTGNFDGVLQTIAERHADNFATFIERTTKLVEPVLLLLVALVVGGVVIMMYMPVFDMASSVR